MSEAIFETQPWAIEQLVRLGKRQPQLVRSALDRLLQEDATLRWALVVSAYQDGDINLGKAAELLGMHELALRDRFLQLGIPLRIGPADVAEARAEVAAIRAWSAVEEENDNRNASSS